MRFVLGIIAGALATLFVATAMDAPTDRIVDQFVNTGLDQWHKLTRLETPALVESTELTVSTKQSVPTTATSVPASTPSTPPITNEVDPDPTQFQIPDDPEKSADHTALTSHEPASPLPTTQPEEVETVDSTTPQQAVVWAPFHSEASARGFATRLTNQLAHPFTVSKTGPANYLVTYEYRDEPSRMELEQQIAYVTGAATP